MAKRPEIGSVFWGVFEHHYRDGLGLIDTEYVIYPVTVTDFYEGGYVDMRCTGTDTDGILRVHHIPLKCIGKSVFTNAIDAAKAAEERSDYYDEHYAFGRPIRRTQWKPYFDEGKVIA